MRGDETPRFTLARSARKRRMGDASTLVAFPGARQLGHVPPRRYGGQARRLHVYVGDLQLVPRVVAAGVRQRDAHVLGVGPWKLQRVVGERGHGALS